MGDLLTAYAPCYQLAGLSGYRFFGMESGTECWGSNDISRAISVPCSLACHCCWCHML